MTANFLPLSVTVVCFGHCGLSNEPPATENAVVNLEPSHSQSICNTFKKFDIHHRVLSFTWAVFRERELTPMLAVELIQTEQSCEHDDDDTYETGWSFFFAAFLQAAKIHPHICICIRSFDLSPFHS